MILGSCLGLRVPWAKSLWAMAGHARIWGVTFIVTVTLPPSIFHCQTSLHRRRRRSHRFNIEVFLFLSLFLFFSLSLSLSLYVSLFPHFPSSSRVYFVML
ncbi:hypothetical protein HYC85_028522 [Camellia sinensis]|uniref:Uncharacterized protein n=1 Tax=Camellia sinensis TaxID=4442 RepID=A0A7J7FWL2_CAMSI|nr:hypothetical protein HYC85_028522 [Camellia sinensis]